MSILKSNHTVNANRTSVAPTASVGSVPSAANSERPHVASRREQRRMRRELRAA